ncbi:hypothetical protein CPB86DRAFT_809887 [Serendipita vermifera]|nr:hypothetical protein CPB86DRAFT_809887 [Serendipita vermifera]
MSLERYFAPNSLEQWWNVAGNHNRQHEIASKGLDIGTFTTIPLKPSRKCRRRSHRTSRKKQNMRRYSGRKIHHRQLDLATSAVDQLVHMGVAGTIDIMSPTVDDPMGEMIASLSVSAEASNDNQFDLTLPNTSPTTFYLTLANLTLEDGNISIHIEVPIYAKESASYVIHCATFDTDSASPLTARECTRKEEDANVEDGQIFSYSPSTGAIRPLQLSAAVSGQSDDSMLTVGNGLAPNRDLSSYTDIEVSPSTPRDPLPSLGPQQLYSSSMISSAYPPEEATAIEPQSITLPTNTASDLATGVIKGRMTKGATPNDDIGLAGPVVLPTASNHAASAMVMSGPGVMAPDIDRRSNLYAFQGSKSRSEDRDVGHHDTGNRHDILSQSHLRRSQRTVDTGYTWKFTPADIIDR